MRVPIDRIGNKIRTLRKQKSQTLEDLSQSTGLSKGLLSQVERGISQPSLETLWKITRALDASIVNLFEDVTGTSQVHVIRRDQRSQVVYPDSKGTYFHINNTSQARLQVLEVVLEPGESARKQLLFQEGGYLIIVLEGELSIQVADQEFSLTMGDSISFEGSSEHNVYNNGEAIARSILIATPQKL